MTLPATTRRAGPFSGNGVTTAFPFTFKVFAASDISVIKTSTAGVDSVLVLNSAYSVALNVDQDATPGGTITYPITGTPLASGEKLSAVGALPFDQTLDLPSGGNFSPVALENALDRVEMQLQQTVEQANRAITLPASSSGNGVLPDVSTRANKFLSFDSAGNVAVTLPTTADVTVFAANLANAVDPAKGSSLVGYAPGGTGASPTTVQAKLRQVVSILDFGADPTGVVACDTALANARSYIASNHAQLVFPAGTYTYSTSPNWGINHAEITTNGLVTLNYTGTGYAVNIDAGPAIGALGDFVYGMSFAGNFKVRSNALATDAVFVRSIHHSKIALRVTGCGPTYAAVRINFSVCTEFDIVVSGGEPNFVYAATPRYGIYCDSRDALEQTAACIFNNPIIEGVGDSASNNGWGLYLQSAGQCTFNGGTSEGNHGGGVYISSNSAFNTFNKLDMEGNAASSNDILDYGNLTTFNGCLSGGGATIKVTFAGINAVVSGGTYNNIFNTGVGTNFNNVVYGNFGGAFSNTGTYTSSSRVYNINAGVYEQNLNAFSLGPVIVSAPDNTATTVLSLPNTGGTRFYQVLAYLPLSGNTPAYAAYALIAQDLTSARIMTQVDGSRLAITLSGSNVQITQTSGITQNVTAVANPI